MARPFVPVPRILPPTLLVTSFVPPLKNIAVPLVPAALIRPKFTTVASRARMVTAPFPDELMMPPVTPLPKLLIAAAVNPTIPEVTPLTVPRLLTVPVLKTIPLAAVDCTIAAAFTAIVLPTSLDVPKPSGGCWSVVVPVAGYSSRYLNTLRLGLARHGHHRERQGQSQSQCIRTTRQTGRDFAHRSIPIEQLAADCSATEHLSDDHNSQRRSIE